MISAEVSGAAGTGAAEVVGGTDVVLGGATVDVGPGPEVGPGPVVGTAGVVAAGVVEAVAEGGAGTLVCAAAAGAPSTPTTRTSATATRSSRAEVTAHGSPRHAPTGGARRTWHGSPTDATGWAPSTPPAGRLVVWLVSSTAGCTTSAAEARKLGGHAFLARCVPRVLRREEPGRGHADTQRTRGSQDGRTGSGAHEQAQRRPR